MDLRQLRSFVSVAQHNGFRRGAASLNVAQPAVSRHIKQLEASLNVELFHRANNATKLTAAGSLLLLHAEELFKRIELIRQEVSGFSGAMRGTVRIGAPSSIGEILFAPLAHRVRRQEPDIHLAFTESSCRLLGLLEEGHIDLAVLSCTHALNRSDWIFHKLVGERVYLVGNPDLVGTDDSIDVARINEVPLILTPLPNAQHQYILDVARYHGQRLTIVAEAESMTGLMALIVRGLGVGVLPFSAAALVRQAHPVAACEVRGFYSWRTLVRRMDCRLSPAGRRAWDMVISEMNTLNMAGMFGVPVDIDQPPFGTLPPCTEQPIPARRQII